MSLNYKNVMVDLETYGTVPGCVMLSIGAVAFDPYTQTLGPAFYCVINIADQQEKGLHVDENTVKWWSSQSLEAREVITQAEEAGCTLTEALNKFTAYLTEFGIKSVKLWGNGSDFDNAILACGYRAIGQTAPWIPWNNRCYRTLKNMVKVPSQTRQGTYHNALDDAKTQALHAILLLRAR